MRSSGLLRLRPFSERIPVAAHFTSRTQTQGLQVTYFVSVESPDFTVTIHRAECELCKSGGYRPSTFNLYLSWSPEFDTFEDAQAHIHQYLSFYRPAVSCSACQPDKQLATVPE
jgi:hypothetical protein